MTITMDARIWAKEQFDQCELKDKRRTDRLVELAASVLSHPAGSLPEQTGIRWRFGDTKRDFNASQVFLANGVVTPCLASHPPGSCGSSSPASPVISLLVRLCRMGFPPTRFQ